MHYPSVAACGGHWPRRPLFVKMPGFVNSTTNRTFRSGPGSNLMASRRDAMGLIVGGISSLVSIGGASALDYPTRPVRFVVGYPPGGATDILARLVGQRLSERLRPTFVIEDKTGAGNNIAPEGGGHGQPQR